MKKSFFVFYLTVLLGYALLNRLFAYIAIIPPLYIGDLLLICGMFVFIFTSKKTKILNNCVSKMLIIFVTWGVIRTVPYISRYGVNSFKDAALWGYSLFAFIIAAFLLSNKKYFILTLTYYKKYSKIFLLAMPLILFTSNVWGKILPRNFADLNIKPGDILVHLSGVMAFFASNLSGNIGAMSYFLIISVVLLVGVGNRAGMLAFISAATIVFLLDIQKKFRIIVYGIIILLFLSLLIPTDVTLPYAVRDRSFSIDNLIVSFTSIFTNSIDTGDFESTKYFRLLWWNKIIDYTFNGPYFWLGKGYGVNLADSDGFQVDPNKSLRSPHNVFLNILARSGVPGFIIWIALQFSWCYLMLKSYFKYKRRGEKTWASLFLFLTAYWVAFLVNASFDVFLEGPMGGIWFWTLFGFGLAAVTLSNEFKLERVHLNINKSKNQLAFAFLSR